MLAALGFGVAVGYLWPPAAPDGPLAAVVLEVPAPDTVKILLPVDETKGRVVTVHLRGVAAPAEAERVRVVTRLLATALVGQPVVVDAIRWHWLGDGMEARVLRHGTDDVAATLLRGGWTDAAPEAPGRP